MKNEKLNIESKVQSPESDVQDAKPAPHPGPLPQGGEGKSPQPQVVEGDQNVESETEYDTLDPISANRNGKIAALSRDIRESLNRRIRRAQPGPDILEWLNAEPSVVEVLDKRFEGKPVTRQNLWEWRHGGYKEWARNRVACLRLSHKRKGQGVDRHQLGDEMAQLYAEELTVTLDELIDFAPDSEVRMQRLEKGLNQIRGWRRSDYHAQRMTLQTERMALDREKLQWRSDCQKQDRELKEEKLKLDRAKYTRETAEWVVKVFRNPNIKSLARDDTKTYAENIKNVRVAMFGPDEDELDKDLEFISTPESGGGDDNIEHPVEGGNGETGTNIQHSTFNAQHSTSESSIEHPESSTAWAADPQPSTNNSQSTNSSEKSDESVPQADSGKTLQNGENGAVKHPAASPSVVPGRPQNEMKKNSEHALQGSPEPKVQSQEPDEKKGKGESRRQTPNTNDEAPKPSEINPQPEGPMTIEQAQKVVEEWRGKAGSVGIFPPGPGSFDYASLKAYLSGEPAPWYNLNMGEAAVAEPPTIDPRRDPTSRWYPIAEKWELFKRAGKVS